MGQKKVIVTFNRHPFGTIHYVEGLRAAVGIFSGLDEHQIDVVYLGDGVYNILEGVDRNESIGYLATLDKYGFRLKVERESLDEREIDTSDVAEGIEVIPRADVFGLIKEADATVDF